MEKAEVVCNKRNHTYYVLFSKSGFTHAMLEEALFNATVYKKSYTI